MELLFGLLKIGVYALDFVWERVIHARQKHSHLLPVLYGPAGALSDSDFEARTQKEKEDLFLLGKVLEQAIIVYLPGIQVRGSCHWGSRSADNAKRNGYHPGPLFALVAYRLSGNLDSLAAEREEVVDPHSQRRFFGFFQAYQDRCMDGPV